MSTSCAAAQAAAEEFENVSVIDTKNLSTGSGLLLMYACDLREAGESKDEIVRKVTSRVPHVQASFIIDKLNYLYKGGRCSGLALFAATALNLKPCIKVKDGKMIVGKNIWAGWRESWINTSTIFSTSSTIPTTRAFS